MVDSISSSFRPGESGQREPESTKLSGNPDSRFLGNDDSRQSFCHLFM